MKQLPERIDSNELLEKALQRIKQTLYRIDIGFTLADGEPVISENLSKVSTQEIVDKIRDFVNTNPIDENYNIFLHYLANYPVSMCKRQVSSLLKLLIGFHYRFGQMFKDDYETYKNVDSISIRELAEIFGRSKATIHECIQNTEEQWKDFLEFKKREEEIEAEAKRELVEEAKERLCREKQNLEEKMKKNEGTSERTTVPIEREVYSP